VGTSEDVPELLDAMDVFVFPSHFEGLPGALIEAMAARLPIVATVASGNEELLENGETGLLVLVRSPDRLVEALCRILSDSSLTGHLAANAQVEATERFSVDRMVDRFDGLYRERRS
jgi:glycosyltransferase involved in cell wall biosynthesis